MNFEKMMKALTPPRKSIVVGGFTFYARPMSVNEYLEHILNPDKDGRDELSIFRCIQDEQGNQVFKSVDDVKKIYTVARSDMINLISEVSLVMEPVETEKKSEATPS